LRQRQTELADRDIQVKIVSFDSQELARQYVKSTKTPFPVLLDTDRKLYRGYGFESAPWLKLIGPISIMKYVWQILTGHGSLMSGSDWQQLGGDVLIDPSGIVLMHHASSGPHDRPTVDDILTACDS
jgi:hypothetical protein